MTISHVGASARVRSGFRAIAGVVAGLLVLLPGAASAQKKQADSYTFVGLAWGSSEADARKHLATRGFRVTGASAGRVREFTINDLHANYALVDRGRRLVAVGRLVGQPVTVDMVFGANNKLHHVIIKSRDWLGTINDARTMIRTAEGIVQMYETQFGEARKTKDDGWIDTAVWPTAKDGSSLTVHTRGVSGFMFSPSYKTAIRVDFFNRRFAGPGAAAVVPAGGNPPSRDPASTVSDPKASSRPAAAPAAREDSR
jgi:hypothetical protein